jgi:hypothetical protein
LLFAGNKGATAEPIRKNYAYSGKVWSWPIALFFTKNKNNIIKLDNAFLPQFLCNNVLPVLHTSCTNAGYALYATTPKKQSREQTIPYTSNSLSG